MVVNMLQNWNNIYYNYQIIIKCVGFKPIHRAINLDVTSSFKVFSKFEYVFLSNTLLF